MLAGLLMSASIPDAFGERGLLFACAYVCMQVGRTAFFLDRRTPPLSHLVGLLLLFSAVPLATHHHFSALALSSVTTVILVVVAVWETMALKNKFSFR